MGRIRPLIQRFSQDVLDLPRRNPPGGTKFFFASVALHRPCHCGWFVADTDVARRRPNVGTAQTKAAEHEFQQSSQADADWPILVGTCGVADRDDDSVAGRHVFGLRSESSGC